MKGKIAFEEHFAVPETMEQARGFVGEASHWDTFQRQLLDVGAERLELMEANGIAFALLSLNAPGVQGVADEAQALALARRCNDTMAKAIADQPERFGGLASIPLHDSQTAAAELERCVRELGMSGCMINGFQEVPGPETARYLDHPELHDLWATVDTLGVPVYLHPRAQIPARSQMYEGHPWLQSAPWGFAVETSVHALRLCGSGYFETFPGLKVCLGHLGENIPFGLSRLDARMRFAPRGYRGARPLGDYFRENFHITVSGHFDDAALRCTIDVLGLQSLYFSVDYPFEHMTDASSWFDTTTVLSEAQRVQVGRDNARALFGLSS